MEKEIKDIKKIYLSTTTPMSATQGFADVLIRLESGKSKTGYSYKYLYFGLAIALILLVGSFALFPANSVTQAVKKTSQKFYNSVFQPQVTPVESSNINIIKRPTATPTLTPTPADAESEGIFEFSNSKKQSTQEKGISEFKKLSNSTQNDEKVKGASEQKENSSSNSSRDDESKGKSDEQERENANDNQSADNSNHNNNTSSEKSNNKDED